MMKEEEKERKDKRLMPRIQGRPKRGEKRPGDEMEKKGTTRKQTIMKNTNERKK